MVINIIIAILGIAFGGTLTFLTQSLLRRQKLSQFVVLRIVADSRLLAILETALLKLIGVVVLGWSLLHFLFVGLYGVSNTFNWLGLKLLQDWDNRGLLILTEESPD